MEKDFRYRNSAILSTKKDDYVRDQVVIGSWLVQKTKHTGRNYKRVLKQFFEMYPGISIPEISTVHVTVFLKQWESAESSTRRLYRNVLSSFFSYAIKLGRIEKNPCLALDAIKVPDRLVSRVLSSEQLKRLIQYAQASYLGERNRFIVILLYYLGLRVSELCHIKNRDFLVREDGRTQLMIEGKGRKVRHIILPQWLYDEVKTYQSKHSWISLDYLLKSNKKPYERLSERQVHHLIKTIAKKAKIDPLPSPHWLRHSNATHALENGAPIHVVQKTLGHASIATTGKYLDIRPQESSGDYLKPTDYSK